MARAMQPVSVAGVEFDALIDESRNLDATVPQYTVEDGFPIADSIILNPEVVNMTLFVTDTPVTWKGRHGGSGWAASVCARLEQLYYSAEPVTITTTDATYTNMAIQSIAFQKSLEVGYAKQIPITFKQVRITRLGNAPAVSSGYGKGGDTGVNGGTAQTQQKSVGSGSDGTILYNLVANSDNAMSKAVQWMNSALSSKTYNADGSGTWSFGRDRSASGEAKTITKGERVSVGNNKQAEFNVWTIN